MRVVVDRDLCEGNAVCAKLVPEVFGVDAADQAQVLVERPPASSLDAVRVAVSRCPRQALSLVDELDGT